MHTKYTNGEIWKVAYPILISLIMEQLIGMTDTAFMGRVGEVELGASAIAGVYYLAIFMLGFGFSIGSQILIARRNGEGNFRMIGSIFYQGIYFLLGMALVMFTLSRLFSPWILSHLVASPRICEAAVSYINWRVFGFFFSFVAIMFRAFFVGTTQTKTLTLNSIVMVMSNVVFNYILVFGKLGFPALGIAGAAIGSSLAELVSMLFFIIYTTRRIDCARYGLNQLVSFRWTELKRIMNVSLWTMIQNAISISTWFLFFIFIEHLGERSLAITNIVRNVSSIPFMTITAFASTCKFPGQQPDWQRRSPLCHAHHPAARTALHLHCLARYSADSLSAYVCAPHLYRHARSGRSCRPNPLGTLLQLPLPMCRIHFLPVRIRHG